MIVHKLLVIILLIKMSLTTACKSRAHFNGVVQPTYIGKNKAYYIERDIIRNHNEATEECERLGMNLASITTEQEFESLKKYMNRRYGSDGIYWLDGYKKDDEWIWKRSGEKIQKFFWHQGEPNDKSSREICINTWEGDFDWNDNDCEKKFLFICDKEKPIAPRNSQNAPS